MSLYISSLNSGSNGNCYYIGNEHEAVLVDAGISCRETEKRMKRQGMDIHKVRAIFISHEHTDHISGVRTLSKKYQLPVYITGDTLKGGGYIGIERHLVNSFKEAEPVAVGGLSITAFKKSHDASDPHSFIVSGNAVNIGIFTDIGFACKPLINYFKQCHAAFLESNYCEDMLMNGDYPVYLKKRISGDSGHLSNAQALELFIRHRGPHLSHLILSHLSKNNNKPELVTQLFTEHAGSTKIIVASRYEETVLYNVLSNGETFDLRHKRSFEPKPTQLTLFT
jgi:phosphoribosyl 1,2-cyclic phosphodiesterase